MGAMVLLLLFPLSSSAKTLTFSTLEELPTMAIAVTVVKVAYEQLGIAVEVDYSPAERALRSANSGRTDGEVARIAGIEKMYPNLIPIPVPIARTDFSVFSKKHSFTVEGFESLQSYRIGIILGGKLMEHRTQNMERQMVHSLDSLVRILEKDRVDIIAFLRLDTLIKIRELNYQHIIKPLTPPILSVEGFHYLHKKHAALVPQITAILKQMKQDGSIQKIVETAEKQMLERVGK